MKKLLTLLLLLLIGCRDKQDPVPIEPFSMGTLTKLKLAPDMGVGSISIGANHGYAGLGAVGFPPTSGGFNTFFSYDAAANSWTTKTSLPQPKRYQSLMFASPTKVYVLGGYNYYPYTTVPFVQYKAAYYKDFWEYNTLNDHWTRKKDLPIDSLGIISSMVMNINGKGFLLYQNKFWQYNESNDFWESKPDLPFTTKQWHASGFVRSGNYGLTTFNTKGFVHIDNAIWEYNAVSGEWKQLKPLKDTDRILFCISDKGYYASKPNADSTYLWEYDFQNGDGKRKIGFPQTFTYIGISFSLADKGYFSIEYRSYMREFFEFTP